MNIGILAFLLTQILVVLQGLISIKEKTFSLKQKRDIPIKLSFLKHWGNIADFFVLPWFNLYAAPLLLSFSWWTLALFLLGSIVITALCNLRWWYESEKASGYIIIYGLGSGGNPRFFFRDITPPGWVHTVLMTLQIAVVGAYFFSPMAPEKVWETFRLFAFYFVPLAIIQPGIAVEWPNFSQKSMLESFVAADIVWGLVILATYLKLHHILLP